MTAQIRFLKLDEGYHGEQSNPKNGLYVSHLKRLLDVFLVAFTAIVSVPLIFCGAVLARFDGGPAFFVQKRVGRDGMEFAMLKLRTMRVDADQVLEAHLSANSHAANEWRVSQKLRHDPRVTRFGGFLRKTSLDELPQLWNVLRGDMSLVGPRPMMVGQLPIYDGAAYFRLRPGLTGLWQVSARNSSSFAARASFDTSYAAKQSLMFDLGLMLRTIWVVLRGTGC